MNYYRILWLLLFSICWSNSQKSNSYDHNEKKFIETFNEPELSLPNNGFIQYLSERTLSDATLTVKTPSSRSSTLVKLKDSSNGSDILSVFIRPGMSVTLKVPLGSYKLFYASGEKWYGNKFLFGPSTSYNVTNDIFIFERTIEGYYEYYSQWTVELILQKFGNLQTKKINPSEF